MADAGRRISDAVRQAILADARATIGTAEGSVRRVAARHSVSDATVRRIVKAAPDVPSFGSPEHRDRMQNAIETRQLTMADRRARLAERTLDAAERALNDMESAEWKVYNFGGKDNTFAMVKVDFVPPNDRRNLAIVFGTMLDKHKMLDLYDSSAREADALTLWLEHMMPKPPSAGA